jgi:hypothetical protein
MTKLIRNIIKNPEQNSFKKDKEKNKIEFLIKEKENLKGNIGFSQNIKIL